MNRNALILTTLLFIASCSISKGEKLIFDSFFLNKSLRIDFARSGDAFESQISIDQLIEEPYWGGSKTRLIDTTNLGAYLVKVFDIESDTLIYSRGFCSLFIEWQNTAEAKTIRRNFDESVSIPFPKNSVRIALFSRDSINQWQLDYQFETTPEMIRPNNGISYPYYEVIINGDPAKKVDIVIIPEGYRDDEMNLFIEDCSNFSEELFSISPFRENRNKFNIYGILSPSFDSGPDNPEKGEFNKTLLNASFYTFGSERYCMTTDYKKVKDVAANAPYDQIYILVNSSKYGGGAIFNYYSLSVNSSRDAGKIFTHELGHGFAGLADEYYTSEVAFNELYNKNTEPWEPNLTKMIDFDKKWGHHIDPKTSIPTPNDPLYANDIGVFEGGGYAAKGVYRPAYDCLMNSFKGERFCTVCSEAIEKMIDLYTK